MSEDRRCFEKHPHPAYGPCDAFGGNGEWCSCCADARWRAEDERDALAAENAALREEVERLRAALAIWKRNFPEPAVPLKQVCAGTCVYECQWLGCDQGCKEGWRIEAYLWARLTEVYSALAERPEDQEVKE